MSSGAEATESQEKKSRASDIVGPLLCISFCLLMGALIWYYEPNSLLRDSLQMLPRKPGWEWYVGMGIVTLFSIVLLLPIWPPMCMAAGLIFGIVWGGLLNFASIFGAAIVSILLGRFLLQAPIRRWIEEGNYPETKRMVLVLEDEDSSIKFQVLFRFMLIPMFIRNYAPSTLNIPIWKLAVGSIPHSIWISFLFASLGASFKDAAELIRDGEEFKWSSIKWEQFLLWLVSLTVAIVLATYAHRKYKERLNEDDTKALAPGPA